MVKGIKKRNDSLKSNENRPTFIVSDKNFSINDNAITYNVNTFFVEDT